MSNPDHFIDEVTEEVRRDRLFATFRRWAPFALAAVVLIVGGAAYNEWRKARDANMAQARGDALLAALEAPAEERAALLDGVDGPLAALLGDDAALAALAADENAAPRYRDLAVLKQVMAGAMSAEDRLAALAPLAEAGRPYASLAREQQAQAQISLGQTDTAIDTLRALTEDAEASAGLRTRAAQLLVALGGDVLPAEDAPAEPAEETAEETPVVAN